MSPVLQMCKCGAIVETKPCAKCKRADNQRRSRKNKEQGKHTLWWRDFRRRLIYQRRSKCERCGYIAKSAGSLSVHYKLGGVHSSKNPADYEVLCLSCHGVVDGARARG